MSKNYAVRRDNVGPRIRIYPTSDGPEAVMEGVTFTSSCGCVARFAVRFHDQESVCGFTPCEHHDAVAQQFVERFVGSGTPEIETETWMGDLLGVLEEEAENAARSN